MNLKHLGDSIRHTFLEDEDVTVAPAPVQQAAVGQPYTLATPISLPAITSTSSIWLRWLTSTHRNSQVGRDSAVQSSSKSWSAPNSS